MKKQILRNIIKFVHDTSCFIGFLLRVIYAGNFSSRLHKKENGIAVLLANGPSLKQEIPKLNTAKEFKNVKFIVLNYFANQEIFFQIKPNYYCFADPMFFESTHREQEVKTLFYLLQTKVDWNVNIYIPSNRYRRFIKFSGLNNKYINVIKINVTQYCGYESFRNYFYKKGLAMPIPGTVANFAIFVALNIGFKEIRLYGVDHTFFDSLCVNEHNQICNKQSHFYGRGSSQPEPILRIDNGESYTVSDYLFSIMIMFKSHDYIAKYSKYLSARILNYTENSMIDSYERKKKK